MKVFSLRWRLTGEAVDELKQRVYVEEDATAKLIGKFLELYQKHFDLMRAVIINIDEKIYLRDKGIKQEEIAKDIAELKEAVETYKNETNSGFQNIGTEQSDMDIMWCYLNAIVSDILQVRSLLGEMLADYVPELISHEFVGECGDAALDLVKLGIKRLNSLYITRI